MSASKAFAFSLALLLGAGTQVSAQSSTVLLDSVEGSSDSSGSISGTDVSTGGSVNGSTPLGSNGGYFWVQGDFGERPGVRGNYASFGMLAPIDIFGPNDRLFVDAQAMVNNNTQMGASVGLGMRHLSQDFGSIFGVNGFYTFDQSSRGFQYNQGGLGAEWLTNYFQLTANAYLPFETQPNNIGPIIKTKNAIFLDNHLAFIDIQHAEAQSRGADVDLAVPIPGAQWLSVATGAYVYDTKNASSYTGTRHRLQANLTNVMLNLSYAHDKVYGNQVNFAATYLFGAQNGNYSPRVMSLYDRLNSRVRRTSRIATQDVIINPLELAINARTHAAWTFAHIDNTAAAGGNGFNLQRYNNLAAANGNGADAILIHRGTTTAANLLPGGTGLVLSDFQRVLGEGCPTFIDVENRPGVPCALPNWATTGTNPFITADPNHNVITLANNNIVKGLNIIAPTGGNAIVGNNVQNFTIDKINKDISLPATTGAGGGIVLTNATGTGTINDFGFNIPSVTGPSGVVISNTNQAPLNVAITNGRFIKGGKYGVEIVSNKSTINATVDKVNDTNSATGLLLQATNSGDIVANVTNSKFDNAVGGPVGTGDGIAVVGNKSDILLNVSSTSAINAARDGLHIDQANGATATVNATTLNLTGAGRDAINANLNKSKLNLTATGVTGAGAADDGFDFSLSNAAVLNAALSVGDFKNVGGDGIVGNVGGGSKATVGVMNTSFLNAGGNGVFVTTSGTSNFTGALTNSTLDSAGLNAVRLDTAGTSRSTLFLTNSDATNAGQNGLLASTIGNSRTDIVLNNEKFDNAGLDAVNLNSTSGSLILVSGDKVSGANAGDDGIQVTADNGRVGLDWINTGSFASPNGDGITFTGINNSTIDINIDGNPSSFNGAGANGVIGSLTDSKARLTLTDVTFQNAALEGIGVTALNSTFNGSITNGSFNNAGSNGARLTLSNSTGNLTLDNTDLFSAGGDALLVDATNGSGSTVSLLNGISLDNAGNDAINVNAIDSTVKVSGSQVSGQKATNDAIHLNANNGQIGLLLANAGSFTTPGGDGIDFNGTNGSNLNIQVQGFPLAAFDNAGLNGVIGVLTGGSNANLGLVNTNFDNATLEGLGVTATNSTFNGFVSNGSFDNAGGNAARLSLTNSVGNLTLTGTSATGAGGNGLIVSATNNSKSVIGLLNGVQLDNATLDAINVSSNANSRVQVLGTGVTGSNAGGDAIDVSATNSSLGQIVLNNSGSFANAGGDGIRMLANGSSIAQVTVTGPGATFDGAGSNGVDATILGGSLGKLTLDDVTFRNVGNDGIRATVDNGSLLQGNLNKVALDNAGGDAFDLFASNNSRIEMVGTAVSGPSAGGDAIKVLAATNSRIDMNLTATGSFAGAGDDGIDFSGTGGSLVNLVIGGSPASFDNAADNGIIGVLNGSNGLLNLTNVTFRNAGTDGLHLDLTNSTLGGTIVNSDFSRPGPAPAGDDGLEFLLNASTATLNLTGTPINNAGDDAVHIEAINASLLNMKLTGGSLVNAGGDMTDVTVAGASTVNLNIDPLATGANQNGLRFDVNTNSILNAIISNSPMSVASDPVGQNGILGVLDTNGVANVKLINSAISNATLDAINVIAQGGSTFNATIINSPLSTAGGDGLDLTLNNATSSITFDNSDIANVGGDAIRVNGTNSRLTLNLSNGISLDNAGGNALNLNATNSRFNIFGNGAVTANNAGADALHINANTTSIVNSTFSGVLALNNAGDNAIDVTALNSTANVIGRGLTTGANAANDAIHLNANVGNLSVQLLNAGTFANAGGDAVDLTGNNSQVGLRLLGTAPGAVNLDGANGNGIVANLTAGTLAQFDVRNFSIQNEGLNGINLGLNNARITNSTFVNGQVDNNGQNGVVGSRDGLRIVADNNSNIGTRATQAPGLIFNGVSFQNDFANPRPQQHGVDVSLDGNSFAGVNIIGASIRRNDGDGVLLNVNPNASLSDSSLAVLNFDKSFVNNNWGDGFHVTATNGIDDVTPPQTSGAIINFSNGSINNNGNFINAPATGIIGDGIGDGIDATATGDGSVAGNTQVTFNLNNTNILGNEEQALKSALTNGGSVNFNLVGGAINGAFAVPCADGPLAFVNFTLNGTSVASSSQLILCAKNNGTLIANVANVDFSNNPGQGVILLAESGGDITANLTHLDIRNNGNNPLAPIDPSVNPPITTVNGAIQGLVTGAGSTIALTLDEIVAVNNRQSGLDLNVAAGGALTLGVTNSNFSDNGTSGAFDAIHLGVTGAGSVADVNLSNIQANNATDEGLDFSATTGGTLNLTSNMVTSKNAVDDGFLYQLDGATGVINSDKLNVDMAGGNAVHIVADNNSTLDIQNLNNVVGTFAGLDGLRLDVLNNSTLLNFNATTLCMHNATNNAIEVNVTNGSSTPLLTFNDVAGDNAGQKGFVLTATDPTVTLDGVTINGGDFQNAGNTGVEVNIANQATPTSIMLTDVNANAAGNFGVQLNVNNVTGGTNNIVLKNVDANNAAGDDGLEVNVTGLTATDTTKLTISGGSSFNNAANEGVDINLNGAPGSKAEVIFSGVSANDATSNGISITPTNGLDLYVGDFRNVTATNAGGDGLQVQAIDGLSSLRLFNGKTIDVSGAAGDGVIMTNFLPTTGPALITLDGLNASNAGDNAVQIDLIGTPGASSITLANVNAKGALGGDAIDLNSIMTAPGDSTAIVLNTVDVSNSAGDGLNVRLTGDGTPGDNTSTIALNGLTSIGNTRDGIDIGLDNGVTTTVTQFNNVVATGNAENGMQIDVVNGSTLTQFTADGLNLSNNGTSGVGFDGLDVQVHDAGSTASFDLSNLTVNRSGGRGIDLDVYDNGTLTFNVDTATIDRSGLGGIDINVGSMDEFGTPVVAGVPGTFNSNLKDVTVTNSGQSPTFTADGVNIDVDGVGTVANVTLDNVTSNNNDQDGFDIRTDNGAMGTFAVNNGTTGNNNAGDGFRFNADGPATVVDLTSAAGGASNVFNNNLGGPGVAINLTNAVTATNLSIAASASGNAGDGVQILANDGTGVTINNFGISGTSLQVNNNQGNGLFIDFFAVNGVNAFDLANISVSGNKLDQIHAQFRAMTMDHISLNSVTTTGTATSDDGIEIDLIDTQLTRPAGTGYAFEAINVVSKSNGDDGLVLNVTESAPLDLVQTAGLTNGLIRNSEFASNGGQGAQLTFAGDSSASFDIFDNAVGFHNNAAEGILIQVQDQAQFDITGTNLINGAQSMYNNLIANNGGIGFHVVASEPLDVNLAVADGSGPRVDLDLGDILRNPNTITGNRDAAMAIEMSGDSTGSFNIVNSVLTNTTNGPNANFNGDGLAFRLNNFAQLESLTVDGSAAGLDISNNAGSGLVTSVNQESRLGTLTRMTVINTTIHDNGLHGIDIQRNQGGLYGPTPANNMIIIGQFGQGNTIRNNGGNGLNIINANMPGGPIPLDIDVTGNTFTSNLNGIFLNGTGNSQFIGNISDNTINTNRQDGIQVRLENDATLGDPTLATNPTSDPFLMAGNQVLNNTRNGIYFDTNRTNESGPFSGGAYVNALIQDSLNAVDGFGVPVRTLISGNGANGVLIEDNSDFIGGGTTVTTRNTYSIRSTDILNNTIDGVAMRIAAAGAPVGANNGAILNLGDIAAADQRNVVIQGNGDDGVDVLMNTGVSTLNFNNITIQNNGATGDAEGGNGLEVDVNGGSAIVATFQNLDILQNTADGMDWDVTSQQFGTVADVTMFGVNSSQNGQRGLDVRLTHDSILNGIVNNTIWDIGRGDRLTTADVNRFNENGREGIVFDSQATSLDQNTVITDATTGIQTDNNLDVFVQTNAGFVNPTIPLRSTSHAIVGNPPATETRIHFVDTVNIINSEIANNGTTFEDGLVLAVGTLTRMNATIAGDSFGGNVGDDIRIYGQRSSDLNPPDSTNANPAPLAGTLNLPQNFRVYDPVAYLDLVFGSVDTDLNGSVDAILGNGGAATSGSGGTGNGDQITVLTFGTNATAPITNDGVFTNNDPVKGGAGDPNRRVVLAGQVQVNGVFNNTAVNDFFQTGVQQNIANQFFFFTKNGVTPYPDPTFPP